MNIKKYAPLGLATMLIFGSIVATTSANEGKGGLMKGFRGQNTVIATAIESGDYDAWVKAVSVNGNVPGFLKTVTKDNFAKFAEAIKLQKQGMDLIQQSHEILKSIGVNPPGPGPKMKVKRFEQGRGERFGQEANETNSED